MEIETNDVEYEQLNQLYDECLNYLKDNVNYVGDDSNSIEDPDYDTINEKDVDEIEKKMESTTVYKLENEKSTESLDSIKSEPRSDRLRKLSKQLPKIIITQSTTSLDFKKEDMKMMPLHSEKSKSDRVLPRIDRHLQRSDLSMPSINHHYHRVSKDDRVMSKNEMSMSTMDRRTRKVMKPFNHVPPEKKKVLPNNGFRHPQRTRPGYGDHPKRLVSKTGMENVALISNVPFERIRLLNDTFHTLINLRWRWIVIGTIVVHFAIWLVFAVFWYIAALAHYDFEPDPPKRTCVTGGKDFVTIFLASVEAQTTIGFGDRAIDEECPESIFLFIMQLILGTGLSGVLTCVVYAKLTRPEKLSRDGVGFSKKAVISMRDGHLCLMLRAWDLNYDHIISSEFTAHFVNTYRTKEGEVIRYYARSLTLQQRQFLLWPVTLVHVIDATSPLFGYTPDLIAHNSYEITVSLKGASASMGTFTQSQTSYLPKEVAWGYRFLPVVKYDTHKQKYVIDHNKLDMLEPVDTPYCCARDVYRTQRHGRPNRSRRVVLKNGEENVPVRSNISAKSIKYMRDIVTTVINSKWRFILLMMVVAHFVFWFIFAAIWYAVASSYQDDIGDGKEHCVTGTTSFAGLLMMSVETQMTIGYGTRFPNEECPEAIIIMVLEIVAGTALSGGLSSLLFTKLIRPNRHVTSVGFSRKAAVCRRDGELCLQFRVWDLMNLHLIGSTITAYMLKPIRTLEGELVHNYMHQLELKQSRALLLWPITVVHVINADSPLYDFSAQDMMDYRFEIVVCLTGASKNMGTTTQSRTSYLSKEIIWGYRFMNVVHYCKKEESYKIDEENLDTVEQVETPLCSASYMKDFEEDLKASTNLLFTPDMSVSPTDLSLPEDSTTLPEDSSTLSHPESSLPSSPSYNRTTGTQRSYGWNFKRIRPEIYVEELEKKE